jgi:hypothetical protein
MEVRYMDKLDILANEISAYRKEFNSKPTDEKKEIAQDLLYEAGIVDRNGDITEFYAPLFKESKQV